MKQTITIFFTAVFLAFLCGCGNPADEEPEPEGHIVTGLPALSALLSKLPPNGPDAPWRITVRGVDLRNMGGTNDGMRPLFDCFHSRYAALNLDACTGATIGWGSLLMQDSAGRPDKDRLVALTLPGVSTRVGYRAFEGSVSLKSVRFPAALQTIGQNAFRGCAALERLEFPASLTYIENGAFADCPALSAALFHGPTPPRLGGGAFAGGSADFTAYVPAGTAGAYRAAPGWEGLNVKEGF